MKKKLPLFLFLVFFSFSGFSQTFFEDFENTTGPDALPSTNWTLGSGNWAVFDNGVGLGQRWEINQTPNQVYQGANSAYVSRESIATGETSKDFLATPLITLPMIPKLSFFSRTFTGGNQGTLYRVMVAPGNDPANQTNPNAYQLLVEFDENTLTNFNANYTQKIVDLTAFAGQSVYIAFVMVWTQPSTVLGDRWLLDNVSIEDDCQNTGNCNQGLILKAFLDTNGNGVKDNLEYDFNYGNFVYQVNNSGTNEYGTSNDGEYYIFDANVSNVYSIHFDVNATLTGNFSCATTYTNITVPSSNGPNYLYFPVTVYQPYSDVSVRVYSYLNPIAGGSYQVFVTYKNIGLNTIPTGTLTFTKDPSVTISAIVPTGAVLTPTGFTYDFTNMLPGETYGFNMSQEIPSIPTVNLGDVLTNSASVQILDDIFPENNTFSYSRIISSSYDPNGVIESHGDKIVFNDFTTDDYLYYTIEFENTGNGNAQFIRIEDTLDSKLDENTFEMLEASHNVDTKREGNQLTWRFYDINLPPTSTNPNGSHGNVHFRIKPKPGYTIGDIIPATASIYFDYNPAIVTNTFNTEFVAELSTSQFTDNDLILSPNPASYLITITNQNTNEHLANISIYDVLGKKIYNNKHIISEVTTIDVSPFAKGIYLIEMVTEKKNKVKKKLILK